MAINPNAYRGFRWTTSDADNPALAILLPSANEALHIAAADDAATDWNVAAVTDPTLFVHSQTTPATDYVRIDHDGTTADIDVVGGTTLSIQIDGVASVTFVAGGQTLADDQLLGIGTGQTARFSWDTTDANANELLLQMPAGGAVDVPVLAIGQAIESVDLGLYNGVVDPRIAMFGVGAVTTGPGLDFRKARGTIASPTVVTTGDDLGTIRAYGAVAAGEYVQAAEIRFDMAGTIATTRGPGTITMLTATDAAPSVLTQALLISAAQVVTLAAGVTTGNHTFSNTITAGADGVGASGEQLTSGGAGAETSWTAAASLREFKNIGGERMDADAVLATLAHTPVYDFQYKRRDEYAGERLMGTGDVETRYTGVMADDAPWAMHHDGKILNPVNAFGYSLLAFRALYERNRRLEERLDHLEAGRANGRIKK